MIYKAKHNWLLYPFFQWYAGYIIRKNYKSVEINIEFKDENHPILILANHASWWDGFYAGYLNKNKLKRRFHIMMLEEQLLRYRFFNKAGAYSVKKKSKSLVESLDYTGELLKHNENLVVIYPQGSIQSIYTDKLHFENGVLKLINTTKNSIHILFLVTLTEYFSNKKPVLFLYGKEFSGTVNEIPEAFNEYYRLCKTLNCLNKRYI